MAYWLEFQLCGKGCFTASIFSAAIRSGDDVTRRDNDPEVNSYFARINRDVTDSDVT